jgi:hypothetical protein
MKKLIIVGFIFTQLGAFLGNFSAIAQINPLADTIWDGNAEIIVPKLIWKQERPKFNRVETVSTVKVLVPIQIWFWGKNDNPPNAMAVCFNQRKVGADPLRAELAMFQGQLPTWAIAQLEQIHQRRPRKGDSIYLYPGNYGLYNLNNRTKKATFRLRNFDRTDEGSPDYQFEGVIAMSGNKISRVTFVMTSPIAPPAALIKYATPQGNFTGTVINLVKSSAKPSDQAAAQFSKFFDLQDQSP